MLVILWVAWVGFLVWVGLTEAGWSRVDHISCCWELVSLMGHHSQSASSSKPAWTGLHMVAWVSAARVSKALFSSLCSSYFIGWSTSLSQAWLQGLQKESTPLDGMGCSQVVSECAHRQERNWRLFWNLQYLSTITHVICRRARTRTQGAYFPVQSLFPKLKPKEVLCTYSLWCIFGPEK